MTQQTSRFAIHPAVTVHAVGTVERTASPRNLIERAASCPCRADAIRMLAEPFGIAAPYRLADAVLSEPWRWSRIDPSSRLMELGEWLKAECFELLDLVNVGPINTKGD